MTKDEIPNGCFGYLTYESDKSFDMMYYLLFPTLPIVVNLLLAFTSFTNLYWLFQILPIVGVWTLFAGVASLWCDFR